MDEIALGTKEIAAVVFFVIVLISIPVASIMVKRAQSLNSKAAELPVKQNTFSPTPSPRPVPANSPLTDLQSLLESTQSGSQGTTQASSNNSASTTSAATITPTPTSGASNISFGPTLNMTINVQGRQPNDDSISAFVGIAAGPPTQKPTYLLTFTVNFPSSGSFNGLSLAGLNVGSVYTAYIKGPGQIDTGIQFTMSNGTTNLNNGQPIQLISGDLNEDNTINSADYTVALNAYGSTPSSPKWNPRADFNNDGVINNLDLAYITANMGKTGTSGVWYSPPPAASSSASLNLPSNIGGPTGSYWLRVP